MIYFLLSLCISVSTTLTDTVTIISQTDNLSIRYPEYKRLNDGNLIPIVSYGTFTSNKTLRRSGAIQESIISAIEAGYRHIETAPMYHVDDDVRNAIVNVTDRGIVTREELFITTKLDLRVNTTDGVIQSLQTCLDTLLLKYVDLYLIHLSKSLENNEEYDILALWRGMEEVQKKGLAVSIGVSNFNSSHINKVLSHGNVRPAVNQIEVNPTYAELELTAYCLRQGIAVMSYGPYGFMVPRPFRKITPPPPTFNDPTLVRFAHKYGKSTKQVALRYLIDRGTLPIPHSTNKDHIIENIQLFDFRLSKEELYQINEFNQNIQVYPKDDLPTNNDMFLYYFGCNITNIYQNVYCDN